jgi:hypothetical protein
MGSSSALWLMTSRHGEQTRLIWCVSSEQRLKSASFATTKPHGTPSGLAEGAPAAGAT